MVKKKKEKASARQPLAHDGARVHTSARIINMKRHRSDGASAPVLPPRLNPTPSELLLGGLGPPAWVVQGSLSLGLNGDLGGAQGAAVPGATFLHGRSSSVVAAAVAAAASPHAAREVAQAAGWGRVPSGTPRVASSTAWDERGVLLAVGCGDGLVCVWDTAGPLSPVGAQECGWTLGAMLAAHDAPVTAMAWCPRGPCARVHWEAEQEAQAQAQAQGAAAAATPAIAMAPPHVLATVGGDGVLRVWRLEAWRGSGSLGFHSEQDLLPAGVGGLSPSLLCAFALHCPAPALQFAPVALPLAQQPPTAASHAPHALALVVLQADADAPPLLITLRGAALFSTAVCFETLRSAFFPTVPRQAGTSAGAGAAASGLGSGEASAAAASAFRDDKVAAPTPCGITLEPLVWPVAVAPEAEVAASEKFTAEGGVDEEGAALSAEAQGMASGASPDAAAARGSEAGVAGALAGVAEGEEEEALQGPKGDGAGGEAEHEPQELSTCAAAAAPSAAAMPSDETEGGRVCGAEGGAAAPYTTAAHEAPPLPQMSVPSQSPSGSGSSKKSKRRPASASKRRVSSASSPEAFGLCMSWSVASNSSSSSSSSSSSASSSQPCSDDTVPPHCLDPRRSTLVLHVATLQGRVAAWRSQPHAPSYTSHPLLLPAALFLVPGACLIKAMSALPRPRHPASAGPPHAHAPIHLAWAPAEEQFGGGSVGSYPAIRAGIAVPIVGGHPAAATAPLAGHAWLPRTPHQLPLLLTFVDASVRVVDCALPPLLLATAPLPSPWALAPLVPAPLLTTIVRPRRRRGGGAIPPRTGGVLLGGACSGDGTQLFIPESLRPPHGAKMEARARLVTWQRRLQWPEGGGATPPSSAILSYVRMDRGALVAPFSLQGHMQGGALETEAARYIPEDCMLGCEAHPTRPWALLTTRYGRCLFLHCPPGHSLGVTALSDLSRAAVGAAQMAGGGGEGGSSSSSSSSAAMEAVLACGSSTGGVPGAASMLTRGAIRSDGGVAAALLLASACGGDGDGAEEEEEGGLAAAPPAHACASASASGSGSGSGALALGALTLAQQQALLAMDHPTTLQSVRALFGSVPGMDEEAQGAEEGSGTGGALVPPAPVTWASHAPFLRAPELLVNVPYCEREEEFDGGEPLREAVGYYGISSRSARGGGSSGSGAGGEQEAQECAAARVDIFEGVGRKWEQGGRRFPLLPYLTPQEQAQEAAPRYAHIARVIQECMQARAAGPGLALQRPSARASIPLASFRPFTHTLHLRPPLPAIGSSGAAPQLAAFPTFLLSASAWVGAGEAAGQEEGRGGRGGSVHATPALLAAALQAEGLSGLLGATDRSLPMGGRG